MPRMFRLPYNGPQPGGSALPSKSKGRGKALGRVKNAPTKRAVGLRKTTSRASALPRRKMR